MQGQITTRRLDYHVGSRDSWIGKRILYIELRPWSESDHQMNCMENLVQRPDVRRSSCSNTANGRTDRVADIDLSLRLTDHEEGQYLSEKDAELDRVPDQRLVDEKKMEKAISSQHYHISKTGPAIAAAGSGKSWLLHKNDAVLEAATTTSTLHRNSPGNWLPVCFVGKEEPHDDAEVDAVAWSCDAVHRCVVVGCQCSFANKWELVRIF